MNASNLFNPAHSKVLWMAAAAVGVACATAPAAQGSTLLDVRWSAGAGGTMVGNAATGSTDVGAGSTASTNDAWNQITTANVTSLSLLDVDGVTTSGVTLTVANPTNNLGPYGGHVNSPSNNTLAPYYANVQPLYSNILYAASGNTITLTFNGLSAGNYNLFLYMGGDNNGIPGKIVNADANGVTGTYGPPAPNSMTAGATFLELTPIPVTSGGVMTVTYTAAAGAAEADLDGLQLQSTVAVPEPASLGLLSIAAMGLFARRRRT